MAASREIILLHLDIDKTPDAVYLVPRFIRIFVLEVQEVDVVASIEPGSEIECAQLEVEGKVPGHHVARTGDDDGRIPLHCPVEIDDDGFLPEFHVRISSGDTVR